MAVERGLATPGFFGSDLTLLLLLQGLYSPSSPVMVGRGASEVHQAAPLQARPILDSVLAAEVGFASPGMGGVSMAQHRFRSN